MQPSKLTVIATSPAPSWQESLSDLVTDPKELLELLKLKEADLPVGRAAAKQFPLKVPRPFVEKMQLGVWNDPLLLQIWPAAAEEKASDGYSVDPLAEASSNPVPGLLHKYQGRVLLTAAPHCAVHCRYCFRRHFDYEENSPSRALWQRCFDYIRSDPSIEEVILSGGDPLALSDRQLGWLLDQINAIEHVTTVRIHSRVPVVIPQRVTGELVAALSARRTKIVLVVHANHGNEIDSEFANRMLRLSANGVTLLNQSVLLKGVNDNWQTLVELSKKLFAANVLPYYLHLPDEVKGTAHFDIDRSHASAILEAMRRQLPGYLLPKLVKEQAGEASKTQYL
jgi:EF-P beta-lysylation protein EpmB